MRFIKHIGVGHHPFSKKYEFKGYFNEPTPSLIATDYKAPKTVLELWVDEYKAKEIVNMTETFKQYDADEQADFTQTEAEEWATEFAIREKEGSPIPREIERKTYEQYSFTYASLFSGIGGFEQSLNQFGGECVFASEIDKFASQAYETLYGHKPSGDITQIDAKDIPDHDLLVGGFPCQAFSIAGKRKGFEDTRGTLFFEIARIAEEKKPKALLLENVKGLVNHDKGRTLDVMIETLNEIGYTVDFEVLNSKYFGVPQNRERTFIVAIREDLQAHEDWCEESTKGQTVVPKGKRRLMKYDWLKSFNFAWPAREGVTTRLRDILEGSVDEKYYLDEEKTAKLVTQLEERDEPQVLRPQRTEYGKAIRQKYESGEIEESRHNMTELQPRKDGISNTLTTVAKDNWLAEPQMLGHIDIKGHDAIKRVYSPQGVSPTLTTMGVGHREPKIAEEQECERKALLPIEYSRKTGLGKERETAMCLSASDWRGLNRNQKQNAVLESDKSIYRIRKLTPRECWRLQGFPDEAHDAVEAAGISDSQRYKQAGNAVTVNVIEAVAERLIPLIS